MLFLKRVVVPETHRALLFKNEQFCDVLMPGVHKMTDWRNQYRVSIVDITNTLEVGVSESVMNVLKLHPEKMTKHVQTWETGEHEVGLVYQTGTNSKAVLKEIKAPAQSGAYWKGFNEIEVRKS